MGPNGPPLAEHKPFEPAKELPPLQTSRTGAQPRRLRGN